MTFGVNPTSIEDVRILAASFGTASASRIRDADFALETSQLTRAQILVNAGTSTLAIANNVSQSVLALLQ